MSLFINLHQYNDLIPLILRFALAATFIVHGTNKIAMWKMQASEQMPTHMLRLMRFLSIAETLGGIALLLGFLTQFAALGLILIMLGALYFKIVVWKRKFSPDGGYEIDILIIAALIPLFMLGAGVYSFDYNFLFNY